MIIIKKEELKETPFHVECCYGVCNSFRLLRSEHNFGFSVNITEIDANTETSLCYKNHLEACLCIEGSGEISNGTDVYLIKPGTLYALQKGEAHVLKTLSKLKLVSIFNPPLKGTENHDESGSY